MNQLMYSCAATEPTFRARQETEPMGGTSLVASCGGSVSAGQCIHYHFKLSAVHILPKLPKITNLSQDLYFLAEVQFPDPSDQLWLCLWDTYEALSSGNYLLISKSSLSWLWNGSSCSATSDHHLCANDCSSKEVLWQGLLCHPTAGWSSTQGFWHKFTSILLYRWTQYLNTWLKPKLLSYSYQKPLLLHINSLEESLVLFK